MCGVCGVCVAPVVVRGAAFLLSLWCSPLRCFGAVWCPPCAVCLPCPRPLLGCWLPLLSFMASSLLSLSSARPFPWHALFPCLRPGVCLCLSLRSLVAPCETKGRVGVCGPSSCIVGTTFVAASRRITYLPSHLCLRVCARSSPFVPYHGVLMSLFPYPPPFVCCLSWCRCTSYAKETCVGGGPLSYSSRCSLVGPTPSLVSVGGAGQALVAPLVCAAWHDMVTYLRGSLLSLFIFSCDACLVAVVLLAWV